MFSNKFFYAIIQYMKLNLTNERKRDNMNYTSKFGSQDTPCEGHKF